jgi:hypothetical protein
MSNDTVCNYDNTPRSTKLNPSALAIKSLLLIPRSTSNISSMSRCNAKQCLRSLQLSAFNFLHNENDVDPRRLRKQVRHQHCKLDHAENLSDTNQNKIKRLLLHLNRVGCPDKPWGIDSDGMTQQET